MPVRTRFAPSPTGYMHIGGMRTALFNWLWARHTGGTFILRIDDTDRVRNIDEALGPILQAFRWLNLHWDEGPEVGGDFGPYFQSQRGDLYTAAAHKLVELGQAYYDYETPEQIQADRQQAEAEKRQYVSSRRSLELSDAEKRRLADAGLQPVLRFLVPRDRKVAIDDVVRGHVEWDCALMPDPVIVRGDGSPLYNFATVVDDALMQITHVIRAEEHLTNTSVQALIHQALGHELPAFAHIPYVAAPGSKEKLSKRKLDKYRNNPQFKKMFEAADRVFPRLGLNAAQGLDPVMVEYYQKIGYLPDAVFNSLARLGWSFDDKTEIMPRQFIVENFTLDRVIKSPAGLDPDKLLSFQAHWMNQLPLEEKVAGCLPYLVQAGYVAVGSGQWAVGSEGVTSGESGVASGDKAHGWQPVGTSEVFKARLALEESLVNVVKRENVKRESSDQKAHGWQPVGTADVPAETRQFVSRLITALGDRIKLFSDILDYDEYFVPDDRLEYSPKDFDKRLRAAGAAELLRKFREKLAIAEPFDAPTLDKLLHDFVEAEGIKIGDIIHALRLAVTGKPAGPGMFDSLELLGRDRCLSRIDRALGML